MALSNSVSQIVVDRGFALADNLRGGIGRFRFLHGVFYERRGACRCSYIEHDDAKMKRSILTLRAGRTVGDVRQFCEI
jgi:hypothetical protein